MGGGGGGGGLIISVYKELIILKAKLSQGEKERDFIIYLFLHFCI